MDRRYVKTGNIILGAIQYPWSWLDFFDDDIFGILIGLMCHTEFSIPRNALF